jgi:hypothetical protein
MKTKKTLHMILTLSIFVALVIAINATIKAEISIVFTLYMVAVLTAHTFTSVYSFRSEWKKTVKDELQLGRWTAPQKDSFLEEQNEQPTEPTTRPAYFDYNEEIKNEQL